MLDTYLNPVQLRVKFLLDGRVLKNTKSILAPSDFVRMKDDILCLPYLHLKITDFSFEIPRLLASHDYPTKCKYRKVRIIVGEILVATFVRK